MHSKLIITTENPIGYITLNYPEKNNAIDNDIRDALIKAIHQLEEDSNVRVIVLKGNGKHFCAGADLNHMLAMGNASFDINLHDAKILASLFFTLHACRKPTVVHAHGKVLGGGLGLLSACDIAIAEAHTQFCFTEIKLGLLPAVIAPFVVQRIGYQAAKYHMMTAELFNAEKALNLGLIDNIADVNNTQLLAEQLTHSLTGITATKKWLNTLHPITHDILHQAAVQLATIRSDEKTKSLIHAFLSKQ